MERSKNGGLSPARRGKSPPFGHRTAVDNAAMQASLCPWHGAVIWRKPASTAAAWRAEHCNERRDRVCARQFHAHVLRSGLAGLRHRSLAHASTAYVCGRPGSAVLLFPPVLDRLCQPLQFRLARLLWEGGGSLHRMGGQPLPVRGRLCEPRLCSAGIAGLQGKPRFATGGHRRAGLLSMGRGRRSRFSDDDRAQFCSRQCWRHFLQRCLGSDLGLHISGYSAVPPGHIGRDEGKKIHARTVASAGV
jgi:hypothetical protein